MRLQHVNLCRVIAFFAAVNAACIFSIHRLYMGGPGDTQPPVTRKLVSVASGVSDECPSLRRPTLRPTDGGEWQMVGDRQAFVFSAYYDDRVVTGAARVRVVALTSTFVSEEGFFCQLWYRDKPSVVVAYATSYFIGEGHDKKYDSTFFECLTHDPGLYEAPYAVSIVKSRCGQATNVVYVQLVRARAAQAHEFTVCVTPLNFRYNRHRQLAEMVEVNRMFGATKLIFYNHSSGHRVGQYLRAMKHEHLVDVIQWPLPVFVDTWPPIASQTPEVHYFAQVAALNDCLYRYMSTSRYIVFTDLDEFIVPRGVHETWSSMLSVLPPGGSAYMFRNAFFWRDWPDDSTYADAEAARQYELITLLKTARQEKLNPYYERSKCIVAPSSVVAMGVHNVVAFADDSAYHVEVDPIRGMVHHYRRVLTPSDIEVESTRDQRMLSFADEIIRKVARRHRQVESNLKKAATSW